MQKKKIAVKKSLKHVTLLSVKNTLYNGLLGFEFRSTSNTQIISSRLKKNH